MPTHRQKYNFYAVTHGRDIGIFTSWTQAGDSVLGFAKAKFKGFCSYTEAAVAMSSAGYSDFNVFDGESTYSKMDYEQSRGHQLTSLNIDNAGKDTKENNASEIEETDPNPVLQDITPTVYIDGSCIRNGASTAQAGYGLYWGDQHPWNFSHPLPLDSTATNNKAELAAAVKALQMAKEHSLEGLTICSDSQYVIQGVTEWIYKWIENGWKTASGEDVKNKDIWMELASLALDSNIKITWKHVAAHSGIPGNEEADKLAANAAKQIVVPVNAHKTEDSSSIDSTEKPHAVPITQPRVIVVQKKPNPSIINSALHNEAKINMTPSRKTTRDRSETPVPGSLNGSFVSLKGEKSKSKATCSTYVNETLEKEHTVKIMTNMETVLQTMVAELHQLREEQLELRKEVKQQLCGIQDKQQEFEKSVGNLSKQVSENIQLCLAKMEKFGINSKREQTDKHCLDEIQSTILNLQKKVDSRLDTTKSSIQSLEGSVSSAKSSMVQLSHDFASGFQNLGSKNNQLHDELLKISQELKITGQNLAEVERSVTTLTENHEFMKPTKTAKEQSKDKEFTTKTDNKFAELQDESDDEVIFKGIEPRKKGSLKSASTQVPDILPERSTLEKSDDTINNKTKVINTETTNEYGKRKTYKRREMVYLVGDSISGQVNHIMLGKATKTFVKKLKASKIEDLPALTDQVKDAKMIIIHTGINNLRDKGSTIDRVNGVIESVASFREVAPESEIVISKVIPVGDHEVDIERNLFNAESEKKLTEINKSNITFIDHGNLAERGVPIKDYYRTDLVHLADQGVEIFAGNIEKEIIRIFKKEEQQGAMGLSETSLYTQHDNSRNTNGFNQYGGRQTSNGNRQSFRQQKFTEGRDQRYNRYHGYQPLSYSGNQDFSVYPSRNGNRDNKRQYYRQYNRDDDRQYNRNNSEDDERHYYRNSYNNNYRGHNHRNYSDERFGEREHRYVGYRDFHAGNDYYGGKRNSNYE